ncbi:MAG: 2-dehydropantoate 2-reductase [Bauldia sp.]
MKVCIYGAGAIGGTIAARLALSGVEPSIVARGAHLAAIKAKGLRFDTPQTSRDVRIAATDDPATLGPQDVVIAAVKAHQLPALARPLRHLLNPGTMVVYAVNGIPWWYFHKAGGQWDGRRLERLDPGGVLWDEVGVDRTIGCVVNLPGVVTEPGVVRYEGGNNRLALGELGGEQSPRLTALAEMIRAAGIQIDTHRPIRFEVWNKLVVIMVASPIAILTAMPTGPAIRDPATREVARRCWQEANAVAAAFGFELDADIDARLDQWAKGGHHRPSILQDLDAGRPLEIDPQITVPLHLAHDAGVLVPTLDMLAGLMRARARAAGLYGG